MKGRKAANVVYASYCAFFSENRSLMGRSKHYSEEQRTLNKKLIVGENIKKHFWDTSDSGRQ